MQKKVITLNFVGASKGFAKYQPSNEAEAVGTIYLAKGGFVDGNFPKTIQAELSVAA